MDPKNVKLNFFQKVKPMILAVHNSIDYKFVFTWLALITIAILIGGIIPSVPGWPPIVDFIVRRVFGGALIGVVAMCILTVLFDTALKLILPFIKLIKSNYEKEALKVKKEVLDNVIEDEVLK